MNMPKITLSQLPDDPEDWDRAGAAPERRHGEGRRRPPRKKVNDHMVRDEILTYAGRTTDKAIRDETTRYAGTELVSDRMGAEAVFRPTFESSKYERLWILTYLGHFYDDKQITDVLYTVKGGKEATVYCCAAHPATGLELIAAKIYRPRPFRQLRNDARYRQGRAILDERGKAVRDGRLLHAILKKSDKGKAAEHTSWLEHEYRTLERLYQAGADVPQPVSHGHSTILMEYFGGPRTPAPLLRDVRLSRDEAQHLFGRLMRNLELMLAQGRIHGDLSAYNVLYWQGDIRIIDFPQAVDPNENPEAYAIFERDVTRLCQYFARQGVATEPSAIAAELWERHGPRTLLPAAWAPAEEEEAE
jgi:RIO kinase 1